MEIRVSIYGHKGNDWEILTEWITRNSIQSKLNRWLIQVPRLYHLYKANKALHSFQDLLNSMCLFMTSL
jgi:AMP deaminase